MRSGQSPKHIDGTPCPEGTQRLPRGFKACCDSFRQHTLACYFDIRYEWWSKQRGWFIIVAPSAGGGGVALAYCPHCGTKLGGVKQAGRWLEV